jgi:hypothetical protein
VAAKLIVGDIDTARVGDELYTATKADASRVADTDK